MDTTQQGMQHREDGSDQQPEFLNQNVEMQEQQDENANEQNLITRKAHSKHHSTGKYKMFSNYSSAKHVPWTSTGT